MNLEQEKYKRIMIMHTFQHDDTDFLSCQNITLIALSEFCLAYDFS